MRAWNRREELFFVWAVAALAMLVAAMLLLHATFPLLTVIWIGVPVIAVLSCRDARRVGFQPIPWRQFLVTAAIALGVELLLMGLVEPWSHVYRRLISETLRTASGSVSASAGPLSPSPRSVAVDSTFGWLVRYPGVGGWAGLFFYSGLVSIFGEELFFRGWLLQLLLRGLRRRWAILLQAAVFTLPQLIAAFFFPPWQAILWVVIYSWLTIGVVGGWAAERTGSIWPSLTAAVLTNLILTLVVI
jgi:membrane protease YdiL (CAAX protease family)